MAPQRLDPGTALKQARSTSHSVNDSSSVLQFHIAINTLYPSIKLPPGDKRWGGYTRNFKPKLHTLETFTADIRAGYSFSPVMKGNHRSQANFISAQHMVLDFDNGDETCSLDALEAHPFIRAHAALLYATPSSTPEAPRSRVFFLLDQQVTDTEIYNSMAKGLVSQFPTSDQTVGEAARFLYGMKPGDDYRILGNALSYELALSLVLQETATEKPQRPPAETTQRPTIATGSWTGSDDYRILDLLRQYVPGLQWRTTRNNRSKYTMRCPCCTEYVEAEANSFTVSEDEKFFNCFACGVKGNAWQLFTLLAPQEAAKARMSRRRTYRDDPNSEHPNDPPEEQSLRSSRYGLMYAARHQLEKFFEDGQAQNNELSTHTRVGGKLVIFTENPDLALEKTELDGILHTLWMDGRLDFKVLAKHLDCGREFKFSCPSHGEQHRYHRKCKYPWCADCGTDTTAKLSNVDMVELEGAKRYREVWFDSQFAIRAKDTYLTRVVIKAQIKRWVECIQSVSKNKAVKGHILARSFAMYLWADVAVAHWKIMFLEDTPGDCDGAVEEIRRKMWATDVASRTYQSGENAIVQLMDDASRTLLGIEGGPAQNDLFWAFKEATKGGHNFQGMATLYKQLREIAKPAPPVCQAPVEGAICGLPLVSERIEDILTVVQVDRLGTTDPPPLRQRQLEMVL